MTWVVFVFILIKGRCKYTLIRQLYTDKNSRKTKTSTTDVCTLCQALNCLEKLLIN